MKIADGRIYIYRLYDIAEEINLEKIPSLFSASHPIPLTASKNSIFIKEYPISLSLGNSKVKLNEEDYEYEVLCKIWHYGVISICLKLSIKELSFKKLQDLSHVIENNQEVTKIAQNYKEELKQKIGAALKTPAEFSLIEDYTSYVITKVVSDKNDEVTDLVQIKEAFDLPSIILAENQTKLADRIKSVIMENSLQYSNQDLMIIDWNSSVIIDLTGQKEYVAYCDLLEFSLSHLLELQVYDTILDDRLNALYENMDQEKVNNETYASLSKEAGQIYIEISEILDRVNNSLKTIGDSYYAIIIRHINKRFRLDDWERSTNEKLDKLMNISAILQDRIESKQSISSTHTGHFFEIIVIILFLIEIFKK